MNYKETKILRLEDLRDFVYRSKKICFAATDNKVSEADGSSRYSNRELPWLYTDHYNGNTVERGTEDVTHDMVLVWSMQYRGGVLEPFWNRGEAVSRFIKHALMQVPREFPARGPRRFELAEFEFEGVTQRGEFIYTNEWEGDFTRFTGYEEATWNGEKAFYHDYIGGTTRNKHFKVQLE